VDIIVHCVISQCNLHDAVRVGVSKKEARTTAD